MSSFVVLVVSSPIVLLVLVEDCLDTEVKDEVEEKVEDQDVHDRKVESHKIDREGVRQDHRMVVQVDVFVVVVLEAVVLDGVLGIDLGR